MGSEPGKMSASDTSPHPVFYIALLAVTAAVFYFHTPGANVTGALFVFWGLLALSRGTFLIDGTRPEPSPDQEKPATLPHILLTLLRRNQKRAEISMTLRPPAKSVILWFGLGGTYVLWGMYVSFFPVLPGAYIDTGKLIQDYLEMQSVAIPALQPDIHAVLQEAGMLCMTGISFWLARTYAVSKNHAQALGWLLFGAFAAFTVYEAVSGGFVLPRSNSIFENLWAGTGWGRAGALAASGFTPESMSCFDLRLLRFGLPAAILIYMAGGAIAFMIICPLYRARSLKTRQSAAFIALITLLATDLFLPCSGSLIVLYMLGWSAIGVLTVLKQENIP